MKLIITDTVGVKFNIDGEYKMISPECGEIKRCIGCFGCWFKTPGVCVLKDGYSSLPVDISKCTELIIVSNCFCGSVSLFVKNVLDRSVAYVSPDFDIADGRMKHKRRYDNAPILTAYFYGEDICDEEKETAEKIMRANMNNFGATVAGVKFCGSLQELAGEIL